MLTCVCIYNDPILMLCLYNDTKGLTTFTYIYCHIKLSST